MESRATLASLSLSLSLSERYLGKGIGVESIGSDIAATSNRRSNNSAGEGKRRSLLIIFPSVSRRFALIPLTFLASFTPRSRDTLVATVQRGPPSMTQFHSRVRTRITFRLPAEYQLITTSVRVEKGVR